MSSSSWAIRTATRSTARSRVEVSTWRFATSRRGGPEEDRDVQVGRLQRSAAAARARQYRSRASRSRRKPCVRSAAGRVRALLTVYPKQHFLLAACVASPLSRKPLAVYFIDTTWKSPPRGRQRGADDRAIRRTARSDRLRDERGTPCELSGTMGRLWATRRPDRGDPASVRGGGRWQRASRCLQEHPSIVFTGAIYGAQADAIRRLIAAFDDFGGFDPHVHLLTQWDRALLAH